MKRIYRIVPGTKAKYFADNFGHIYRKDDGAFTRLSEFRGSRGYQFVMFCPGGRRTITKSVHPLVCVAFHGPKNPGQEVRHRDGNKSHNKPSNLRWGTRRENVGDALKHGVHPIGEKHGMAKLTDQTVRAIRERYKQGTLVVNMVRDYGVARSTINRILSRKIWAHVD